MSGDGLHFDYLLPAPSVDTDGASATSPAHAQVLMFDQARVAASNSCRAEVSTVTIAPPTRSESAESDATFTFQHDGHFHCPWCHDKRFDTCSGSVRHTSVKHVGSLMDASMVHAFTQARRSVCCDSSCGGLRMVGKKRCDRCAQTNPCRAPVIGGVIVGSAFSDIAPNDSTTSALGAHASVGQPADVRHQIEQRVGGA